MAQIDQVANGIYRISSFVQKKNISFTTRMPSLMEY